MSRAQSRGKAGGKWPVNVLFEDDTNGHAGCRRGAVVAVAAAAPWDDGTFSDVRGCSTGARAWARRRAVHVCEARVGSSKSADVNDGWVSMGWKKHTSWAPGAGGHGAWPGMGGSSSWPRPSNTARNTSAECPVRAE